MNKSLLSLTLVLPVFFLVTCMARPPARKAWGTSGPYLIENLSAPDVIKIGSYAVSEYDKTATDHLEFIRVVNGSTLGIGYYPSFQKIWFLFVEAKICKQHGKPRIYYTQVTEMHDRCPIFAQPSRDCNRDYLVFQGLRESPSGEFEGSSPTKPPPSP